MRALATIEGAATPAREAESCVALLPEPATNNGGNLLLATRREQEACWLSEWGHAEGLRTQVVDLSQLLEALHGSKGVVLAVAESDVELLHLKAEGQQHQRSLLLICETWADINTALLGPNDDFIRQPYTRAELLWRASRAVARCAVPLASAIPTCGSIRFDALSCAVCVGDDTVPLRRAERDVLVHLLKNQHRFVSTAELQHEVLHSSGNGGAVRNQVYQVRKQLARVGASRYLQHEDGKGYRLYAG